MNESDALKRLGTLEVRFFPRKGGLPTVCNIEDLPDYEIVERRINAIDKLSDSFGVDVVVLLTALSKGIFYKTLSGQIIWELPSLICLTLCPMPNNKIDWCLFTKERVLPFNEYGNSWALTKDELK